METLLVCGVDPNAKNKEKETALFAAVRNGHYHTCRLLIERGVDVNAPNSRGLTPSMLACQCNSHLIIDLISKADTIRKMYLLQEMTNQIYQTQTTAPSSISRADSRSFVVSDRSKARAKSYRKSLIVRRITLDNDRKLCGCCAKINQ